MWKGKQTADIWVSNAFNDMVDKVARRRYGCDVRCRGHSRQLIVVPGVLENPDVEFKRTIVDGRVCYCDIPLTALGEN